MTERLTLAVEDGTREKLIELAGSERKIGQYVSSLVRAVYEDKELHADSANLNDMAHAFIRLQQRVQRLEDTVYGD